MKLLKQLQSFSSRRYFSTPQDKEDFIQYAVEKRLEGSNGSFENLYLDFLRHTGGRAEHVQLARRMLQFKHIAIVDRHHLHEFNDILNALGAEKTIRAILTLKYLWELKDSEIAYAFGVSQAAIYQRQKLFFDKIKSSKQKVQSLGCHTF